MVCNVHNLKGTVKANKLTMEVRVTLNKDEKEKKKVKIVSFSTEMKAYQNLKEPLEVELKKIFQEPIHKIRYLQKAESTLFKLHDKIIQRVVDRAELEGKFEELKEDRESAVDDFYSTHRGIPEDEYDLDEYEDDVLDELDDAEREDAENEREELEGYVEAIRDIDRQIKEIKKRLQEPEDFVIGEVDSEFSEESEIIVDTVLRTVPVSAISSFFNMFLCSSDLSYEYEFKPFMVPLSLELANYDKDEKTLDFGMTDECYRLLKKTFYELYKAIPSDECEVKEDK